MTNIENTDARGRILEASIRLFSEKGFDGARVNEIADDAQVNKALIYYYFESKEAILDSIMESFLSEFTLLSMDFIRECIVAMIEDGRLDIEADRLSFVDKESVDYFIEKLHVFYREGLEYVLKHREVIRVIMLESLKRSKHHNNLFRFMKFMQDSDENPIYTTVRNADNDFTYSTDMVVFRFFFSLIPLVSFAAYFDTFGTVVDFGEEELRDSFLRSAQLLIRSLVSGTDILLRLKPTAE